MGATKIECYSYSPPNTIQPPHTKRERRLTLMLKTAAFLKKKVSPTFIFIFAKCAIEIVFRPYIIMKEKISCKFNLPYLKKKLLNPSYLLTKLFHVKLLF